MSEITLRKLQKLATDASRKYSRSSGIEVQCECLGQPYAENDETKYRLDPKEWVVPKGKKKAKLDIAFQWHFNDPGLDLRVRS